MTKSEILEIAKPILFNSEMVRAILDGRKTQTRRIANINSKMSCHGEDDFNHEFVKDETGFHCQMCGFGIMPPHSRYPVGTSAFRPRYNVGDYLYVRETWGDCNGNYILYRADYPDGATTYDFGDSEHICDLPKWKPSIHLPKEAARLFLKVTDVRCERLQDISSEDVDAEGCKEYGYSAETGELMPSSPIWFKIRWDSTVKKSELDIFGWNANPWVWVYEFERVVAE